MQRGDTTRDIIIRKSAELFNKHGFDGCSMSDIMKATGLQKGGIYNHFKNKDEIALEAFDHSFSRVIQHYRKRLDTCVNSYEKLCAILDVFKSHVLDPVVPGGCPLINTAVYATDTHPGLVNRALEAFTMLRTYITIKIEEGKASGEFRSDVDSEETATIIMSSLDGAIVMSRLQRDSRALEITLKFVREKLVDQLLAA